MKSAILIAGWLAVWPAWGQLFRPLNFEVPANSPCSFVDPRGDGRQSLVWMDATALRLRPLADPSQAGFDISRPAAGSGGLVWFGRFDSTNGARQVLLVTGETAWLANLEAGAAFRPLRMNWVPELLNSNGCEFCESAADFNLDGYDDILWISDGRPMVASVVQEVDGLMLKRRQRLELAELGEPLFGTLAAPDLNAGPTPLQAAWNVSRGGMISIQRESGGMTLRTRRFAGSEKRSQKWVETVYQATSEGLALRGAAEELRLPADSVNMLVDDINGDGTRAALTWTTRKVSQNVITKAAVYWDLSGRNPEVKPATVSVNGLPLPGLRTTGPLADVNGDGQLDLVLFVPQVGLGSTESIVSQVLRSGLDIVVSAHLFNRNLRNFDATAAYGAHAFAPAGEVFGGVYGDADGDGIKDVWLFGRNEFRVYCLRREFSRAAAFSWTAPESLDQIFPGKDLNNDGRTDLMVRYGAHVVCFLSAAGPNSPNPKPARK